MIVLILLFVVKLSFTTYGQNIIVDLDIEISDVAKDDNEADLKLNENNIKTPKEENIFSLIYTQKEDFVIILSLIHTQKEDVVILRLNIQSFMISGFSFGSNCAMSSVPP